MVELTDTWGGHLHRSVRYQSFMILDKKRSFFSGIVECGVGSVEVIVSQVISLRSCGNPYFPFVLDEDASMFSV